MTRAGKFANWPAGKYRAYGSWQAMHRRCKKGDTSYPRYAGRGIKICERWADFETFYADMGPRPAGRFSIDRVDNDGDYEPANCRWATARKQARGSIRFPERFMSTMDVADLLGVTPTRVRQMDDVLRPSRTVSGRRVFHESAVAKVARQRKEQAANE